MNFTIAMSYLLDRIKLVAFMCATEQNEEAYAWHLLELDSLQREYHEVSLNYLSSETSFHLFGVV